ncbi:hypothetical protein GDO86_016345 [Hymenochirus boettgeri]|nr:hypothetical protein GDO86_016345 [Hymenochirus boettgeri]
MNNEHEKVAVPEGEIKNRQQKDAELDKKIQALKKKNEALIKRYKEIEEDRKNSETVSIAASSRRQKPDSLTITIMKAPNEKRVVNECFRDLSDSEDDAEQRFSFRMGNKVELAVTMDSYNKQGKKIAMKKMDQDCGHPEREPCILTKEQTDDLFTFGRGRRMQIAITMEKELTKRNQQKKRIDCNKEENKKSENGSLKDSDATLAATVREQIEYIRWKKEREQIDQERLARQKNSKGEWRRLWDAEKTLNMFHDTPAYSGRNHDGYCGKRGEHLLRNPSRI